MLPNILLVVADDLGWSDLGAFGGEINTPNRDALALAGMRLTNFHTAPVCAPTRAMLMTGADHHEVGLGVMHETITPAHRGKPGHEGHLNDRAAPISARLNAAGYRTVMAGKWHLGRTEEQSAKAWGFERSFSLMGGEHNHYGMDQTDATGGTHGPTLYREDGKQVIYPEGEYSTDYFAARLSAFISAGEGDARPLFAYLPFTAPHSPLQAPEDIVAKYRGWYDDGPEALRERRLARMRELNLPTGHWRPAAFQGSAPWGELSAQTRAQEAKRMEVYAAMVECMDRAVGRVMDTLRRVGKLENLVVFFLSDNGPAGVARETMSPWKEMIAAQADNSVENIGRASSYASTGPRWAQAQAAPFSLFKRFTTEGGVRTCSFVTGLGAQAATVQAQRTSDTFLHVMDYAATILDLGGVEPKAVPGKAPMRGHSALAHFAGKADHVRPAHAIHGWEFLFGRGIRQGDWKAVYLPAIAKTSISPNLPTERWQLFNLANDPGETTDLAEREPEQMRNLLAAWDQYARETGVVLNA